jgi:hypothetical protein
VTMRSRSFVWGLVVLATVVASILVTPAAAKKKPPPPPPPPPPAPFTSTTYVRSYANVLDGVRKDVTAHAVQATTDGGSVALSHSDSESWVVKFDAAGNPQWQEQVGCFGLPGGGYSLGVALQQTADGGYVIAGGMRDCEFGPICPYLTSQACGLIVKLDAAGNLVWTRIYSSGRETTFWDIKQTPDTGFVVVGTYRDTNGGTGSFILKLDAGGTAEWQTLIRPLERTYAYLEAVQAAADGGYVAAGRFYPLSATGTGHGVLAVKVDSNGNVRWQRGFNSFDASGAPTASEGVDAVIQTSDGGYLVAGSWSGDVFVHGDFRQGPLLLKLDAAGNSDWQKAYSAGLHCSMSIGTRCDGIGGLAHSVHEVADGGYVFAGAGHLKLGYGAQLVPSLTKTDANGNFLWQRFYYETYPSTGAPISQYFASSSVTSNGGLLAVGFTQNPVDFKGELFAVRTDSAGLVGACGQVHPGNAITVVDPGFATIDPGFPVQTAAPEQADLPARTRPTSISARSGQC